jgi:anti-sigma factor RsiW
MDCARIRFLLNAYLDGEVSDAQRRQVFGHLSRCRRCALRLESFERVRSIVKDRSERRRAPADLCRRIAERRGPGRSFRRVWRPIIGAAAISLFVIPVVADSVPRPRSEVRLPGRPVERVERGRIFCLGCALRAGSRISVEPPGGASAHLAAFQGEDGKVWILLNREICPDTFPAREVAMAGRFFESAHVVAAESLR